MKPFDLEAAKRGEPIVCRDGTPAKFIAHVPDVTNDRTIVVYVTGKIYLLRDTGAVYQNEKNEFDLFMAPKKRTVWVNLYKGGCAHFDSEEMADAADTIEVSERIGGKAYPLEVEE